MQLISETKNTLKVSSFKFDRRMGTSSNWFKVLRRKLAKSSASSRDIIVIHSNPSSNCQGETIDTQEEETANLLIDIARASTTSLSKPLTREDIAATKIQAHFRGHLARRAFRALKSLVKLQAMVRGARVRKQARIALHCMHSMVRLQVTVRARQLLGANQRLTLPTRLC